MEKPRPTPQPKKRPRQSKSKLIHYYINYIFAKIWYCCDGVMGIGQTKMVFKKEKSSDTIQDIQFIFKSAILETG